MNTVILTGRLTRDPELRDAAEGRSLCRVRIAVPRHNRDAEPVYVDVVCFDGQASACANHLAKGHRIGVEGRLHYSEWEANDGSKRSRHEVIAQRVEFLEPAQRADAVFEASSEAAGTAAEANAAKAKDAIPF